MLQATKCVMSPGQVWRPLIETVGVPASYMIAGGVRLKLDIALI